MRNYLIQIVFVLLPIFLGGCGLPARLLEEGLPVIMPEIPGIPRDLQGIEGLLEDLGLPDLSSIADLPGVDSLPGLGAQPGMVTYRGPVERGIEVGSEIPGTDIILVAIGENTATFMIAGLRSERRLGDSLDFDGGWSGLPDVSYHARLRIYHISNAQVRAAGVDQLEIGNSSLVRGPLSELDTQQRTMMNFPYTTQSGVGEQFGGITYGYRGVHERGAELTGLDGDAYPYRKLGDSVDWEGQVRADVRVSYQLRLLYYGESRAQLGGIVSVYLGN